MELLKLYTALVRRRWLVLYSIVFFTVAAAALALLLPKNYRSTSKVLVSSSDTSLSILSDLGLGEVAAGLNDESDDIANRIQMAMSRPVIEDVIWRLQLRDEDGRLYTHEELLVPGLFGELEARPNISITQQQGTDILAFEARGNDPQEIRLLADTLVKVAIQTSQDDARADTRAARMFIETQLVDVQAQFEEAGKDIADAKVQNQIIDLETETKAALSRISELMLAGEQNAAAIQDTRARLAQAKAYQKRESVDSISPMTANLNSRISGLRERITTLEQERIQALMLKKEKHPDVLRLDELLESARSDLVDALKEQHALDPTIHSLEVDLAGQIEKGAEIIASIDRATEALATFPDKLRSFSQLELVATAAESVYKSLEEQRYQIGVAEAMLFSDLQLMEPAQIPDRHYSPKLLINLVLGFGLGCLFGIGIALLYEYVDDTVKSPDDLDENWPLLRLGVVPRFKIEGDRRVIDSLGATHPISEAYRTVRNGLLYASLDKPLSLIAVSSALPGEGKSTFVINLAISFAREGKEVLVVDCDLRRPAQHRNFPTTSNHIGITDVLTQTVAVEEAIQDTSVDNVHLLTSGVLPTDPARLIESLRFRQLLLDLQKSYDVVLVDTPPALVVNDAMVIARSVDGIALVVESGRTSGKTVEDLRQRFESAAIEPIGLVLNKLEFYSSGYGHYARAYKAYQADTPETQDMEIPDEAPHSDGAGGVA
jgi:capsular exopolysaccharide synthesis family protein